MKKSFFILGFLISLLISCPPPTPEPGPDEGGSGSGNETAKEFTVSFDANGGTGTIAPMKVKAGTEITLPDGTAFTRKYFTFNYWTISGSDFYEAGSKYTVKADTVFAAAWRHNQVSITYDSNHEEINKREETWADAGSDLILPGNLFASSPSGKYFYGWTTAATATEADILAPGSAFRVEETALTFYAYWGSESVTEYTVTFSGTEMDPITFNKYTEEIRLPLYTGEDGMVCKGWDTDAAATTVVYEDGGTITKTNLTGNIVLYPILDDTRVALTWKKNGNVSPDNSDVFPDRTAPGDFLFMAYAVTKDSGDGKVWILESVTAETVSGKPVSTRKEMMDGLFEIWYISVPAEATVITLNWKEKTDVTITSLTVKENCEYTEGDPTIDFWFICKADFDPAQGNLKITKDDQEVEILSYHYEPYSAEEKIGYCELSSEQGEGQYLLQIIVNDNVLKEASFNVTLTDGSDPIPPQTHTVTFNAGGGNGTVDPMTPETGTAITLPSTDGLSRPYYTFTAWETGGQQYNPGEQFTVNADTVFTAVWKSSSEVVSLTWNKNGAEILSPYLEESALFPATLTSGTTFKFPAYAVTKKPASGANPFLLTGLTVETADGTTVAVSEQTNSESGLSEWSFTTGSENLNITLNWQEVTDPSVSVTQVISKPYNPNEKNFAMAYMTCNFNPYPEMLSLFTQEDISISSIDCDCHFEAPFNGQWAFQLNWAKYYSSGTYQLKINVAQVIAEKTFVVESTTVSLSWNYNGGNIYTGYSNSIPETFYGNTTYSFPERLFYKDDGTDTPYILTGIKVTETESGQSVTVTSGNDEYDGPFWSFTTTTEPLTVELLWEKQISENYQFNFDYVESEVSFSDENTTFMFEIYISTDLNLSSSMIRITNTDGEVMPDEKMALKAGILDGLRAYSVSIYIPVSYGAGTYTVDFCASGSTVASKQFTVTKK